jgi:2-polyprenyl-3-methyl-5-hydroxy-6-metoxy-1,4-benzoquinol methylase
MIGEAKKLHPENQFEIIGMQDIGKIDRSFDALLFLASFHHLESVAERLQVLRDSQKLLTPGGRIYMTNWSLRDQAKYKTSHR